MGVVIQQIWRSSNYPEVFLRNLFWKHNNFARDNASFKSLSSIANSTPQKIKQKQNSSNFGQSRQLVFHQPPSIAPIRAVNFSTANAFIFINSLPALWQRALSVYHCQPGPGAFGPLLRLCHVPAINCRSIFRVPPPLSTLLSSCPFWTRGCHFFNIIVDG